MHYWEKFKIVIADEGLVCEKFDFANRDSLEYPYANTILPSARRISKPQR